MVTRVVLLVLALVNLGVFLGVFLRRLLKNRFFILKDESRQRWSRVIEEQLRGQPISARRPSRLRWDREAAEEVLLARWATATLEQRRALQGLFRLWGLFELRLRRLLWGNPWEQGRSALVLAQMQCREALPAIAALLISPIRDVRLAAVNALGMLGETRAQHLLLEYVGRGNGRGARPVLGALVRCSRRAPGRLLTQLEGRPPLVRQVAAGTLAELGGATDLPALIVAAGDSDPEVRAKVARALGRTRDPAAFEALERLGRDPVWYVRLQAMGGMGWIRSPRAEDCLWAGVEDPDWQVCLKAATALHRMKRDPVSLLARLRTLADNGRGVRALVDALEREGATWHAVNRVASPIPSTREESQALVRELLRSGAFSAVFYALEMHPDPGVREQLLRLAEEKGGAEVRLRLTALLQSTALEVNFRRQVENMLKRLGGAA